MALSVLTFIANFFIYLITGLLSLIVQFYGAIFTSFANFLLSMVAGWVVQVNDWGIYAPLAIVLSFATFGAGVYALLMGARMASDFD